MSRYSFTVQAKEKSITITSTSDIFTPNMNLIEKKIFELGGTIKKPYVAVIPSDRGLKFISEELCLLEIPTDLSKKPVVK